MSHVFEVQNQSMLYEQLHVKFICNFLSSFGLIISPSNFLPGALGNKSFETFKTTKTIESILGALSKKYSRHPLVDIVTFC